MRVAGSVSATRPLRFDLPSVAVVVAAAEPVLTDEGVSAGVRIDGSDHEARVEPSQIMGAAPVGTDPCPSGEIEGTVPVRRALPGACRCRQEDVTVDASGRRV